MKKVLFIIISVLLLNGVILLTYPKAEDRDTGYSLDLYEHQIEKPSRYDTRSHYKGVMSTHNIEKMMEDIERLNLMDTIDMTSSRLDLQEDIELPKLSQVFGIDISLSTDAFHKQEVLPESVTMEELAKVIVEELLALEREGIIIAATGEEEEEVTDTEERIRGRRRTDREEELEPDEVIEREVKFKEGSATISYLIFGKRVVVETPIILAGSLAEREERLRREIEYLSSIIEERGRQRQ